MKGRSTFKQHATALAWPILTYHLLCGVSLITFTVCIALFGRGFDGAEDYAVMAGIWFSVGFGTLMGQLLSLTRVRSTLALGVTAIGYIVSLFVLATLSESATPFVDDLLTGAIVVVTLCTFYGCSGFWSLRTRRGLFAIAATQILTAGSIIAVSESTGHDRIWHAGEKYGIWTGSTLLILGVSTGLIVAFLVARERHRLHRWRSAPIATELTTHRPDPFRPMAGMGSWLMVGALVLCLTLATAVVSPYLWRTGDGEDPGSGSGQEMTGGETDEADGPSGPGISDAVKQGVKQAAQMGCVAFTLIVLAAIGLLVFARPTRRLVLLAHLRDPYWPLPPSRQALLHWRLAEIALGDAGVHRLPGETALHVARRGLNTIDVLNLESLEVAATVADRVAYGYALQPGDIELLRRAAEMTYQAIWESLTETERFIATYRGI